MKIVSFERAPAQTGIRHSCVCNVNRPPVDRHSLDVNTHAMITAIGQDEAPRRLGIRLSAARAGMTQVQTRVVMKVVGFPRFGSDACRPTHGCTGC